nr:DUF4148 domain-containing protein [Paraburkholderia caballeronis]
MLRTALVSMLVLAPAVSFAQQAGNGSLTRAQVRQELVDLESVGYNPASANDVTYPQDVQAAMQRLAQKRANEARVAQQQQNGAQPQNGAQAEQSGYGEQPPTASASGGPATPAVRAQQIDRSLYGHH